MQFKTLNKYLLTKKESAKDFPFGPETAVYKICEKMFALVSWTNKPLKITLKCDPDEADIIRSTFKAVQPGYYMNKTHWNTITIDGTIPDGILYEMIDSSYSLVVKGLRKADKLRLE